MARHRAISDRHRWRWSPDRPVVPVQRRVGIELVDGLTRVAHWVSPDELLAGRQRGNYQALCGVRLLAASMADPGRRQCQPCREQAMS